MFFVCFVSDKSRNHYYFCSQIRRNVHTIYLLYTYSTYIYTCFFIICVLNNSSCYIQCTYSWRCDLNHRFIQVLLSSFICKLNMHCLTNRHCFTNRHTSRMCVHCNTWTELLRHMTLQNVQSEVPPWIDTIHINLANLEMIISSTFHVESASHIWSKLSAQPCKKLLPTCCIGNLEGVTCLSEFVNRVSTPIETTQDVA